MNHEEQFIEYIRAAHEQLINAAVALAAASLKDGLSVEDAQELAYNDGRLDAVLDLVEEFMPEVQDAGLMHMMEQLEEVIEERDARSIRTGMKL